MKYIIILAFALSLTVCATTKKVEKETPFTVRHDSPRIRAGEIEAQFDKLVSLVGIKKVRVIVNYYPLEDAVSLQYKLEFMTFNHFFDKEGRAAYLRALEKYKEDYEQKKLKTKGDKQTRRQYGKVNSYVIWQAGAYTVRSQANADVDFGYDIVKVSDSRAAFFTIYRRETTYAAEHSQLDKRVAQNTSMYLTRSQADDLAALFDQDFLKSLNSNNAYKRSDDIFDEY